MTTTAIRTKVHKYIDEADAPVLEVVLKLLEVYRKNNEPSLLTEEQKKESVKRLVQYKAGKMKAYTVAEARQKLKYGRSK